MRYLAIFMITFFIVSSNSEIFRTADRAEFLHARHTQTLESHNGSGSIGKEYTIVEKQKSTVVETAPDEEVGFELTLFLSMVAMIFFLIAINNWNVPRSRGAFRRT